MTLHLKSRGYPFRPRLLFSCFIAVGVGSPTVYYFRRGQSRRPAIGTHLEALSRLLLYPAVALLAIGIFIGAVWANVSWGRYWSWDPKEVWALITLIIYALPLHCESLRCFRSQRFLHVYLLIAFVSVLVTYFGVNFFLGGMHSYA